MEDRRSKYNNQRSLVGRTNGLSIDIKFDITELDLFCAYIVSDNKDIRRGNIITLRNVFDLMNMNVYGNDRESLNRIDFIRRGIESRLNKNLSSGELILKDILGGLGINSNIKYRELDKTEVAWVNQAIAEIVKYANIQAMAESGMSLLTRLKSSEYTDRGSIVKDIELWTTQLQNVFRKSKVDSMDDMMFSLSGDNYIQTMQETYRQLTSPSNCLVFGTQALNLLTGGGLQAGRVYVLLGLPGEGKSSTMLDMAIQIKKYNRNYQCKDPTKRPCVVLFVMENSIKETVQRLFSMCMSQDMTAYGAAEAIERFRQDGLTLNDQDPIDLIVKFRPNLSEDTSYLYTIVDDLEDQGYEVICLIQDYLKRIRSVDGMFGGDLRLQLGAVVNEFKTFATLKNIPIVTASQLNRAATNSIDTAKAKNKSDLVRIIGRSNVGESNLILENSDWVALIAPEEEKFTGSKYLGIQRVKSRYYISDTHYAYIPYVPNTIKFVEDSGLPPMHKLTLKSEDEINMNAGISSNVQGGINEVKEFSDFAEGKLDNATNNIFDMNGSMVIEMNMSNRPKVPEQKKEKKLMYRLI